MTLRVTFLGTSGAVPTARRNPSGIYLNREGEELLFDCGEGTQRQMMRFRTGFSISAVFLTHVHGDHVLGLPGLCQTLDFNDRADPLAIYTPRGTRHTVEDLVGALDARLGYPLEVREAAPGETVHGGEEYEVRAFRTEHRTRSVGYALVESDRKGRFDRERAEELGVPVGPKFGALHSGESIELEDGTAVEPEQVVGPPRPGRRVVYTGDTRPTEEGREAAADADLLIHDATFGDDWAERARETGHATAREAGELAAHAGAKRLALTHISSRYAGDASELAREASEAHDEAFVAEDGLEVEVSFPE
ncbi:ribonuclease Z [Halalkalicoccus subterraneus]|uniref:ribonuclease Z n=1 Tax=Halalkalicoccus subterraneus TaxID=2675002 RepID=UPI000EFB8471|nr:ribonuclease Z [Halalkalicoccus subterraneus]